MGFLSGLLGGSKSTSTSASGYSALSPQLRGAFDKLGLDVEQYTNPNNPANLARFTPMAQTADETAGLDAIRRGFTPTADSLQSDISMLMNPFDQFVTDDINRQAGGDYSILKQDIGAAGQLGSNRQRLGANDIEQTRLGTIGKLRQGQYNQALGQIFNNLVPQRMADAQGLLGIGQFQRGLDTQTKQAPIAALQAGTGMLAPFVSGGANTSISSGGGGLLSGLGSLASGIGTGLSALRPGGGPLDFAAAFNGLPWSDIRLKENIIPKGMENGHKVYEFSYKGDPRRFVGVMAHEVPEAAVEMPNGYYAVDYRKLGVKFREVYHGN